MNKSHFTMLLVLFHGGCHWKSTIEEKTSLILDNAVENADTGYDVGLSGTGSGASDSKDDFESLLKQAESALQDNRRVGRIPALSAACKMADKDQAEQILDLVIEFEVYPLMTTDIDELKFNSSSAISYSRKKPIIWIEHFVQFDVEYLLPVLKDHTRLYFVFAHLFSFNIGRDSALQRMAQCKVPQSLKNQTALKILDEREGRLHPFEDELLWKMINEDALVTLRKIVRTPSTPREFDVAAADFLSHFGDEEILSVLKAGAHGYYGTGPTAVVTIDRYIWRIEVQHPPTKLLEYVSSVDFAGTREWRDWAVRKAHSLGLDNNLIRKAILEHVQRATTRIERIDLPMLKKVGLDLDILEAGDLPEVDLSIYPRIKF